MVVHGRQQVFCMFTAGGGAAVTPSEGARMTANHSAEHRATLTTKNLSAQNVTSAMVEQSWYIVSPTKRRGYVLRLPADVLNHGEHQNLNTMFFLNIHTYDKV